jgi:glutamate synthase domain-containing protein 2/glutamate synthase domain-containing protein 1/glutamate synthase domain-containing protein 3
MSRPSSHRPSSDAIDSLGNRLPRAFRSTRRDGMPAAQGLYDPANEHDNCGFGFIASIKNKPSHDLVDNALTMLENMEHRGACGCEPDSGDGAGILVGTPDKFFRREATRLGFKLPKAGEYAVAMCFLPHDMVARQECEAKLNELLKAADMQVLGWRDVPHKPEHCGPTPRSMLPKIRQAFVSYTEGFYNKADFNRRLYLIRQQVENFVEYGNAHPESKAFFYVNLMSTNRMVYKGMLTAHQLRQFYPDLSDPDFQSAFAIVHSRFSTNTFPSWRLAHPYRYLAHNGEINTLRGNRNWMKARYGSLQSERFGDELNKLFPILSDTSSDSATLDNTLQFLVVNGRPVEHAVLMLIPEAWQNNALMDPDLKAFYEYHACLMEPWDGPAGVAFTDGTKIGAVLDRNGLRPARYCITKDDHLIMASEAGVLPVPAKDIVKKWRLQPGKMLLIDLQKKKIIDDQKIKQELVDKRPWKKWVDECMVALESLPEPANSDGVTKRRSDEANETSSLRHSVSSSLLRLQHSFGYTNEDLRMLMYPMAATGQEAIGSMGTDTPLACLSDKPQLAFNYFKQLFAQVTNPPLDAIREEMVTSLFTWLGREGNLLSETPENARLVKLKSPIITNQELAKLKSLDREGFKAVTLPITFNAADGEEGMARAVDALCEAAAKAVKDDGATILILSDRGVDANTCAIPSLVATGAVHHHLIREGTRTLAGLVVETAEAREAHHFCLLIGYGAGAVNPYLALDTIADLHADGMFPADLKLDYAIKNYLKAANKAILKVASKMGISTVQSYRGAQIFEAIGLGASVVEKCFAGTASRIGGIGLDVLAKEALMRHRRGFPPIDVQTEDMLDTGGQYQWRRDGETHAWNPITVARLQHAVRSAKVDLSFEAKAFRDLATDKDADGVVIDPVTGKNEGDGASKPARNPSFFRPDVFKLFKDYSSAVNDESRSRATIRGLLEFTGGSPIPIEEVEPATEIVKRFATGAMSFGSISKEAHETLAIAMNRIGGRSNSGEGGEDADRFNKDSNGDWRRSAIKQVASGRFGVTSEYLVNCEQVQIKIAQGAKPGEGGQLPGHKVDEYIAKVRHSTPGVGLISPPPHHDIYSIEDLAQLIHDLKNANHTGTVSVKLVSEVGVGTVAAGVAKAKADHIVISGDGGGTGASPLTSIKYAGLPWELGLSETQQILVMNGLRGRVRLQTDGQIKTGRDVAIAALLGAEEVGFATAPLIAAGCVMMRVCHLNTCPVGIATQDPELRKKFTGTPEHVINFMFFIAEEVREYMAQLGFRTWNEMVGRVDKLKFADVGEHWKAKHLQLDKVLFKPEVRKGDTIYCTMKQDHGIELALDNELIKQSAPVLTFAGAASAAPKVRGEFPVKNTSRTIGTMLSGAVAKKFGFDGLPQDTIRFKFLGSAGQSFGAFLAKGITLELEGESNDYVGKGLSGGRIAVYPPADAGYKADGNIIAGNVICYGAIAGEIYLRGVVGERFCVRNSGASAVVEGVGDHGCEYMTGGRVVVIGPTGRNFAAGMSGGIAYVYDDNAQFPKLCNMEMVELSALENDDDVETLKRLLTNHAELTGSTKAKDILANWEKESRYFVKVMPTDYRRVYHQLKEIEARAAKLAQRV